MAEPKQIQAGDERGYEQLVAQYVKRRREIRIWAYSEGMVSISMSLGAFLNQLGISLDDCRKALEDEQRGERT